MLVLYFFVQPFLPVRHLLSQRACDRRETQAYYGEPHGAFSKGVNGRRVDSSEESAARIPSFTGKRRHVFLRVYGR